MTQRSSVICREARCDRRDLLGIWDVCRETFQKFQSMSYESFERYNRCLWENSPARTTIHPFGWVLEDDRRGIVGFLGLIPLRLKVGNELVPAGGGHSWAVKSEFRVRSLALMQRLSDWGEAHPVLITGASEATARICDRLKLGFRRIPVDTVSYQLWWPLRPEPLIEWALRRRGHKALAALSNITSIPICASMTFRKMLRWGRPLFPCRQLTVKELDSFDGDFDELWEDQKGKFEVTCVRTRANLAWRHKEIPSTLGRTIILSCYDDNGKLCGYLTLQERRCLGGDPPGLFAVTDCFYDPQRIEVLHSLLNRAYETARTRGGNVLQVSDTSTAIDRLLRMRQPYIRRLRTWPYWYKAPNALLERLNNSGDWWPTASDGESNI